VRGIYVGEQEQPTLERNTCRANQGVGIRYAGSSGLARDNTCTDTIGLRHRRDTPGATDPRRQHSPALERQFQHHAARQTMWASAASCANALALIPSSAVLETLLTVHFFIGQGTLDDQESDNLVYIDALTHGELHDNLGYPLGNFWRIAHSQLLR
jgi:parallel beta-helix repeat protein